MGKNIGIEPKVTLLTVNMVITFRSFWNYISRKLRGGKNGRKLQTELF
jgi:hypothetical protein